MFKHDVGAWVSETLEDVSSYTDAQIHALARKIVDEFRADDDEYGEGDTFLDYDEVVAYLEDKRAISKPSPLTSRATFKTY